MAGSAAHPHGMLAVRGVVRSPRVERTTRRWLRAAILLGPTPRASTGVSEPKLRSLAPAEVVPQGSARAARTVTAWRRARRRIEEYALMLLGSDQLLTGLTGFARTQHVVAARFTLIGAVRDPEVGWFDPACRQRTATRLREETEVLSLVGDIATDVAGAPVAHAHVSLGRSTGVASAGRLVAAAGSATVKGFVTTFSSLLQKRDDAATDLQLIAPGAP